MSRKKLLGVIMVIIPFALLVAMLIVFDGWKGMLVLLGATGIVFLIGYGSYLIENN